LASHIENATRMASAAGLSNAHFEEVDFETLANSPVGAWPKMNFIILHGVWSWVSPTQRAHLLRFIESHLTPGGIVYNAYNGLSGWAALLPVQKLLRHIVEQGGTSGAEPVTRGVAMLREMIDRKAAFFIDNPVVARRLNFLSEQDLHYVCHELLHANWEPSSFDMVASDMASARLGFIGSATLLENFDEFSVPSGMVPMLGAEPDPLRREILRDFGAARMFRRDLYRRGTEKPPEAEWLELFDEVSLLDLGLPDDGTMKIRTWGEEGLALMPEIYGPIRQGLRAGLLSIGELRTVFPDPAILRQILAVLTATGIAHPVPFPVPTSEQIERTHALNLVVGQHNARGGKLNFLLAPRLGTAVVVDEGELSLLSAFAHEAQSHVYGSGAVTAVARNFAESGRTLYNSGQPVTDPDQARAGWSEFVQGFAQRRLPLFERIGALAA